MDARTYLLIHCRLDVYLVKVEISDRLLVYPRAAVCVALGISYVRVFRRSSSRLRLTRLPMLSSSSAFFAQRLNRWFSNATISPRGPRPIHQRARITKKRHDVDFRPVHLPKDIQQTGRCGSISNHQSARNACRRDLRFDRNSAGQLAHCRSVALLDHTGRGRKERVHVLE